MSLDPITAVSDLIKTGLDKFFPDANVELKGKLEQAAAQISNDVQLTLGQLDINKVEAASPHWFVAGGRPAAIWVGVLSLLYSGVGISLLSWIALCAGLPVPPPFTDTTANTILMGLLGLGGMRTAEKLKGVETKKVGK
jgi:hypothetical protein